MARGQGNSCLSTLLVLLALGGFGFLLWSNAQPAPNVVMIVPTQATTPDDSNAWQDILRSGFGSNSTPLPTIAIPSQAYAPPTLALPTLNASPVAALAIDGGDAPFAAGVTPTPLAPPSGSNGTDVAALITPQVVTREASQWNPPALIPPISRDPLGRDHYWFARPVDSNATNNSLFYYPYGSDGPDGQWRVHHGIDMPNPVGEPVRAAGAGTVIWAADGLRVAADGPFQNSPSYGNVIVIEHDFGYRGEKLWTLYAHLSAVLVQRGQYVYQGDVIGLVGQSGIVSGPHLHFEVRMGENAYRATYNPLLWMVPYVGTGVIAGIVSDTQGNRLNDWDVTIRSWATGQIAATTTTYVFLDTGFDVNPDPLWGETFAVGDLPSGRYEVIATIDGVRVSKVVIVLEGQTTFVELKPDDVATPQDVPTATPQP